MGFFVDLFDLKGVRIITTVTNEQKKVDVLVRSFMNNDSNRVKKVIGLDTQWVLFQNQNQTQNTKHYESKCATLHLCDGRQCLIIQLQHLDFIPNSLLNFLRLPDYTFVGVGIKDNLAKLEKHYGLGCRNAVELRELAATVMNMPHLSFCGLDELASVVTSKREIQEDRPLSEFLNDWGQTNLNRDQAELATIYVYSYYNIGSILLSGDKFTRELVCGYSTLE